MKQSTLMKTIILISVICYFLPMLIWWFVMAFTNGYVLSYNNADWGEFGSFVGGVLSPVFGLISIVFIYHSIMASDKNHQSQIDLIQKQDRRNYLLMLVNIFNEKINENLKEQADLVSGQVMDVYAEHSKTISHPEGSIRKALLDFDLLRSKDKQFKKSYIEFMQSITANVGLCFSRLLDHVLEIEDATEFKQSMNLIEAMIDFHGTNALLEVSLNQIPHQNNVRLLDKLLLVNEKTVFRKEVIERYRKVLASKKI